LYAVKQYPEAAAAFRKGIALKPEQGTASAFLGLCEYQLHDNQAALRDLQKGQQLGLGSNHQFESAVRQTAALILIRAGHFDEAIGELQPLAKFGDNSPGVVAEMGLCALALPKAPEDLTPKESAVVALAGQAQWASTSMHPQEAKTGFEQLVQQYPAERGVHYAYGLFLMEQDEVAALNEFEKETAAYPDFWPAWLVVSSLETKAGAPEKALAAVQKAEKSAPAEYHWLCAADAGSAFLAMGKADRAVEEFKIALHDRPGYPQLHYNLSRAYSRNQQPGDARRENAEFKRLSAAQDPLATSALQPAQ
jgi:tetratricopeptide (TPR) repeat protein